MTDDATLLRHYATNRSEEAFAELARRHLPLVYSAAVRRLDGDTHRAADVTQSVFAALARNAAQLSRHAVLTGWLYTATRNAAITVVRAEKRRRVREKEAHTMHEISAPSEAPADWEKLKPVLDDVMDELDDRDREVVLLRFFQNRPFAEIADVSGLSEDAARKRVERAVDKLGGLLRRHGITSTSAALATILASETALAAPASLASSVVGVAMAGSGAAGAVTFLAMTKLQIGIAAVLIAGGVIGIATQQRTISALREHEAAAAQHVAQLANENARLVAARTTADADQAKLHAELSRLEQVLADEKQRAAAGASRELRPPTSQPRTDPVAAEKQQTDLHQRYDPFLQKYGLSPEQADRFVALKIAIYDAQDDLQVAVRQAGAQGDSADVEAMRSKLVGPLWKEIYQLLGPEGTKAYGDYEMSSAYRPSYLEPMEPAFVAANAALSPAQGDQLLHVMAANVHSVRVHPTDISTARVMDWDAVVAQAGNVLTPPQLIILQAYAQQMKARQRAP